MTINILPTVGISQHTEANTYDDWMQRSANVWLIPLHHGNRDCTCSFPDDHLI